MSVQLQDQSLPSELPDLRQELEILPGPALIGGAPSWMIYDPVQARYFQISIELFEILSLWSTKSMESVIALAKQKFGRLLDTQDLVDALQFLSVNQLILDAKPGSYQRQFEKRKQGKKISFKNLASAYLFFRVPLCKPDKFLQRTYPAIKFVYSRYTMAVVMLLALIGVYLVSRQWSVFLNQFQYLFSVTGLMVYILSLISVKVLHELGHAYTAIRYGSRVNTMGIAFMVMVPILYTDTTDAWRLKKSSMRTRIDVAGILVELSVAAIATLVWVFLSDGPLRSAVFALATTSWVLSLAINLNPFMKFDGYYLLSDSLGLPNLQPRSFELAKWQLRHWLFGVEAQAPEVNHVYRKMMIYYGYCVWIYRFFLFLGIALLVYHFFFKVLGIVLFLVEIVWFIGLPIYRELKVWWSMRDNIVRSKRSYITAGSLLLLIGMLFVPFQSTLKIPAVMKASQIHTLYAQHQAQVLRSNYSEGDIVKKGDVLFELASPQLDFQTNALKSDIRLLKAKLDRRAAFTLDREQTIVLQEQLNSALEQLDGNAELLSALIIKAPFSGVLKEVNPILREGLWVNRSFELATIISGDETNVSGYLPESVIGKVDETSHGVFVPRDAKIPKVAVTLGAQAMVDSRVLEHAALASTYGGQIASKVVESDALEPIESMYAVEFSAAPDTQSVFQEVDGTVRLSGIRESVASKIWQSVARVSIREMGL